MNVRMTNIFRLEESSWKLDILCLEEPRNSLVDSEPRILGLRQTIPPANSVKGVPGLSWTRPPENSVTSALLTSATNPRHLQECVS